MDTLFPKVLQAVAGKDFTVYLYFNDGSVRLYDAKPLLALGGVFAPLQDEAFFKSRLTVLNDTVMSSSLYYKAFNLFNPFL